MASMVLVDALVRIGVAYDRATRVVERARSARSDDVLDEVWDALGRINLALDEAMNAYADQGMR